METLLTQCPLFEGFSAEEISLLLKDYMGERTFEKGSIIAMQGDEYNMLYILTKGKACGYMDSSDGKRIKIHSIESPNILAPLILYAKKPIMPISVEVVEECKVIAISRNDFTFMMQHNDRLLINFVRITSDKGSFLMNKVQTFAFHSIKTNLAHYLMTISKKEKSNTFIVPDTQEQLAEMFSVTRPALASVIKTLTNKGIISSKGKQYTILDKDKLEILTN